MIRVAVCDDDARYLDEINMLVRSFFDGMQIDASIYLYKDAESLLQSGMQYDIYLLDILMPGQDGIGLAQEIRGRDRECVIIYLTTSDEYALNAYRVGAMQYLLKPVDRRLFSETMERALHYMSGKTYHFLPIHTPGGIVKVDLTQTAYVEHYGKVLYFHLADNRVVRTCNSALSLSEVAPDVLACPAFIRPYRAFLVNMDYIQVFSIDSICMADGHNIPVSRRCRKEIRDRYMDYLLARRTLPGISLGGGDE